MRKKREKASRECIVPAPCRAGFTTLTYKSHARLVLLCNRTPWSRDYLISSWTRDWNTGEGNRKRFIVLYRYGNWFSRIILERWLTPEFEFLARVYCCGMEQQYCGATIFLFCVLIGDYVTRFVWSWDSWNDQIWHYSSQDIRLSFNHERITIHMISYRTTFST